MVPGPQGPQGPTGDTGATGATGPQGPIGLTGPQGPPGADSNVPGPVGPEGPTGATGAQGPIGPAGPTGAPGPTAVSTDANNSARIGSDGLIFVPPIGASQWDGAALAEFERANLHALVAELTARVAALEARP